MILHFFNGCENRKCLSPHCKSYIVKRPELEEMRKDKKKGLSFVLQLLKDQKLDIFCTEEKSVPIVDESVSKYKTLFRIDFQEMFRSSKEERDKNLKDIEQTSEQAEKDLNYECKKKVYSELDKSLVTQFYELGRVLQCGQVNFDFVQLFSRFLVSIRFAFQIENFGYFKNLQNSLKLMKLEKMVKHSFRSDFTLNYSIDKNSLLQLIENLQNTATFKKMEKESIHNFDEIDVKFLRALYSVFGFFFYLNKHLPDKIRIDELEFKNDSILTEKEYNLEIVRLLIDRSLKKGKTLPLNILGFKEIPDKFNFLDYPFLFTVAQKVDLLRFESRVSQQIEMQNSVNNFINNPLMLLQGGLFLELNLRRNHILEDTLNQLHLKGKAKNLKKSLKIKFVGEPGVDEGGLTKEFFQILIDKLFNPNFGMFVVKNERYLWFNSDSFECNLNFELIGMLLGLALYNFTILDLHFPMIIYKKLRMSESDKVEEFTIDDFKELEPELFISFSNLLKNKLEDESGFYFSVNYQSWGIIKEHELIKNGADIEVTEDNKQKFVQKYLEWYFNESIFKQFEPFCKGFYKVLTGELVKIFNTEELYLAICGSSILDFRELKKTTKYEDGYTKDDLTIQHFWKILLDDFDESEKKKFLKFLTGSDRAPLRGLADIKMAVSRYGDGVQLPAAHTCFNHLLLPDYKNLEVLKEKLQKAIENCEGFGLL